MSPSGNLALENTGSLTGEILRHGGDEDGEPAPTVARAVITLLAIVTVLAVAGFATAFASGAFG